MVLDQAPAQRCCHSRDRRLQIVVDLVLSPGNRRLQESGVAQTVRPSRLLNQRSMQDDDRIDTQEVPGHFANSR